MWNSWASSDLDWGELENYGADSELWRYLVNHDGKCDYGDIGDPSETDAYNVFPKCNIGSEYQEGGRALVNNFETKCMEASQKLAS